MNNSLYTKRNEARKERQQQKLEAGFLRDRFTEVAGVTINMTYNQRGIRNPLPRVVNFFPDSYAVFIIDCLNRDCVDGGFDLTQVIRAMIRDRRESAEGDLSCEGEGPSAGHSSITYKVAIKYT
jgi:hypothetical protein